MITKITVDNLEQYLDVMQFKGEEVAVSSLVISFPAIVEIPQTPDGHTEMTYNEFDTYRYFYNDH